jgi:acid phosphatase
VPLFSNVFVILMENTSWSTLQGDSAMNTPYLHGLITTAAYATDYHGVAHPSLPNYIALTSGSVGVQSDGKPVSCDCDPAGNTCTSCNALSSSCGCEQTAQHLGDQIEAAGKTWKAYGESMGTPCNLTGTTDYAPRHVPFVYYQNLQSNSTRCNSHVVDYGAFSTDLASPPSFVFVAPNLTDDMHGTSFLVSQTTDMNNGDKWLAANVPAITGSNAFKQGGILIIVWDEDDGSGGLTGADDPIPIFVLSPFAKSGGYKMTTHADHYALLATIEDGLALPRLGSAANAQPITDFFPAN